MISFFRRLLKDRRGNVLAIACAALPLVVGCAGLATDTIQWTLWKRQLQRAADSAAIAGVYDRENASGSTSNTLTAVSRDLAVDNHVRMSLMSGYPQVSYPSDSGAETDQVAVTLKIRQSLPFSSLFMSSAPIITASATAASISTGTPCALALNSSGTAMDYSGNATVTAPTCILYSDSSAANAAAAGGSSAVHAKAVAAVGGISHSNNFTVDSYIPYSPSIPDPYASVAPDPTQMHCTNSALTNNTDLSKLGTTNCFTSLSVGSNKSLNLTGSSLDGQTVYINGGGVDLKGAFTCTCTIVLTNVSTDPNATIGTFSSNAQANNNITAPMTGAFAGIAIYQDRRATGNTDTINGGSGNNIAGAVYFPKDTLRINGTGLVNSDGSSAAVCASWVANNITFLGNSSIAISSPSDAVCAGKENNNSAVKSVRLVA